MLFIVNLFLVTSLLLYVNIMLTHFIMGIAKKEYSNDYNPNADALFRLILIIIIALSLSIKSVM